ncbi:MAG: ATPase, partial [Ramlibacter sp.]|nr:ATPase [Ramlibacter sp.]
MAARRPRLAPDRAMSRDGAGPRPTAEAAPQPAARHEALTTALQRLDAVLGVAIERQAGRLGTASLLDPWLGMHLDVGDVRRLLAQQAPPLATDAGIAGLLASALREIPGFAPVAQAFALEDVDLAALLVALAPDVDLRYERIYGYLQDDLTRRRPSTDLLANLLASDAAQRLAVCARLARPAPLLREAILVAGEEARSPLAQEWRVDRIWRVWLLQGELADAFELGALASGSGTTLAELPVESATRLLLEQACELAGTLPLRLCLHGEHGAGKLEAAGAIAQRLGRELLPLDLREFASVGEVQDALQRAGRASCLFAGLLYLHGLASLEQRDPQLVRAVVDTLDTLPCHLVLSCVRPPAPGGRVLPWLRVELTYPSAQARHALWQRAALLVGAPLADADAAALAARFSLGS